MEKRSEIERLAYELYEKDGCCHGHAEEHWLQAEMLVNSRHANPATEKISKEKKIAADIAPKGGKAIAKDKTGSTGKTQGKVPSKTKKGRSAKKEAAL